MAQREEFSLEKPNFQEKLRWPFSVWSIYLALCATISFSIWAALGNFAAAIATLLQFSLISFWSVRNTLVIALHATPNKVMLHVDRAQLPLQYIKDVTVLDSKQMSLLRTRDAKPSAHLALRFWVKTGIKIDVMDPLDPTPYWLISTKNGALLKEVITRNLYR